jgi:hypothetical protein
MIGQYLWSLPRATYARQADGRLIVDTREDPPLIDAPAPDPTGRAPIDWLAFSRECQ